MDTNRANSTFWQLYLLILIRIIDQNLVMSHHPGKKKNMIVKKFRQSIL